MLQLLTRIFNRLHQAHCRALGHYIVVVSSEVPNGTRTRAICMSCAYVLYDNTVYEKSEETRSTEMIAALRVAIQQSKQFRALYLDDLD